MIYIFSFFTEICALPGRICTTCSKLCSHFNCKPCQDACAAASQGCRHFVDKPLASYVVLSGALSIAEIVCCNQAFNAPPLDSCLEKMNPPEVGIRTWLV